MYIDLKTCLTCEVPTIDLNSVLRWSQIEKNYFKYNDSVYYHKMINLDEFIGEELSKQIKLQTINFEIFKDTSGQIFMASKSFKKTTCTYFYPLDFIKMFKVSNHLENFEIICLDTNNYINFLSSVFKMFAVDIYMGQIDRFSNNIQIEIFDTGYVDLAPVYDYSSSEWNEIVMYHNALHSFVNEDDYLKFFIKYPSFLEILKNIQKVSMNTVLENIENNKGILLPNEIRDIYLKREENSQKKLEKIIK